MAECFSGPAKLQIAGRWKVDINARSVTVGVRKTSAAPALLCLTTERGAFPAAAARVLEGTPAKKPAGGAGDFYFDLDISQLRDTLVEKPLYFRAFDAANQPLTAAVPVLTYAAGGLSNEAALKLKYELVPDATPSPIKKKYGGPGEANGMFKPRGLAIHTTAGRVSDMADLSRRWDATTTGLPASAHFGIDLAGTLYQYIALSYRGFAIDGNTIVDNYWYSVEVESGWFDAKGKEFVHAPDAKDHSDTFRQPTRAGDHIEEYTDEQVKTCARLFAWLAERFDFPVAKAAAGKNDDTTGRGLSCHRWLDVARGKPPGKNCPGDLNIALMDQIALLADVHAW